MKIKLLICGIAILFFSFGCDVQNSMEANNNADLQLKDPIKLKVAPQNILYQLSYEETKTTFSTRKPADLENKSSNSFRLDGYERTKQLVTIDRQGNLKITTEWLDGNAGINMPIDSWQNTSNIRPANPHNYKPIVKSELANGSIRYFAEDGSVLHEYSIDNSQLKVNPQAFQSMLSNTRKQKNDNARVADNLEKLQNHNINFERISDHFAEIASNVENDSKVVRQKQILDLRIGRAIKSFDYREDGKIQNWDFMDYAQTDGIPVLRNSMSESFADDENDNWSLATRTIINRKNIELYLN